MGRRIKTFSDGSCLEYDRGGFDDWCVYFGERGGGRRALTDVEYFGQLKELAGRHGAQRIYGDYLWVYDRTGKTAERPVLEGISQLAAAYGEDAREADIVLSVLYLTMIAEENKKNTRLGKRIKRLGVHSILFEGRGIEDAANFTRGMGWRDIDALCRERGF